MKPALMGIADSDRESQNGRAARTESSHGASDCHSLASIMPPAVSDTTIMTTPGKKYSR